MDNEHTDPDGRDPLVRAGVSDNGDDVDPDTGDQPPQTTEEDPLRSQILEKAKTGKATTAAALSSKENPAKKRIRDDLIHNRQLDLDARMMGPERQGF